METNNCYFGDVQDLLPRLASAGVQAQTLVTSPPYWNLRDYGTAAVAWPAVTFQPMPGVPAVEVPAWEGSLGLEPDPLMFTAHLVHVFRLAWGVLAEDGTVWLNLGDSFAGSRRAPEGDKCGLEGSRRNQEASRGANLQSAGEAGLKNKDQVLQPARVALALQADGWYLRSDVIWAKPNPMPQSVTDRPTSSHEHLFLLAKGERYFYDADAIREPLSPTTKRRPELLEFRDDRPDVGLAPGVAGQNGRRGARPKYESGNRGKAGSRQPDRSNVEGNVPWEDDGQGRNKRDVWEVGLKPYPGAHTATFPPGLVEPCILAGSRPGDLVLDPFMGSGTVAEVAERLGRNWIGVELQEGFAPLQDERTGQPGLAI